MPAIAYEIEEFEVPAQKYTFLKACLKFIQPIVAQQLKSNADIRTLGFCVIFLVNHVLLKIPTRVFKSIQEKVLNLQRIRLKTLKFLIFQWQIIENALMILNDIVENYFANQTMEIESNENKLVTPGELLVSDLLRGGVLYNLVS